MSPRFFWLGLIVLFGSCSASDVPFVFGGCANLSNYSSVQLEEASSTSPDLIGVPSVILPPDNDVLEIPVTGGSLSESKLKKEVIDLKDELNKKVEPGDSRIRDEAVKLASRYPGDLRIEQIREIYFYLKDGDRTKSGWKYVRDPRGIDTWNYANESLKIGDNLSCVSSGDCDDFAILMAAFVESIGGATRIILANNSIGGHAYTEVYLGQLDDPNNWIEEIIEWLKQEDNAGKIYGHIDTEKKEVWLNLDWGPDEKGNAHPGGPLFQGDKHYVLRIRDDYKLTPLRMAVPPNWPPRLISLTPDKNSPQEAGSIVTWTAKATDHDNDPILYRFFLNGRPVTRWTNDNSWVWTTTEADIGDNQIEVWARDGEHAGPTSFDSNKIDSFSITSATNKPPRLLNLTPDKSSPQEAGSIVTWTANAIDPDNDRIKYGFFLNDESVTNWINANSWVWTTTKADIGENKIEVQVRDEKHTGPNSFDSNKIDSFSIKPKPFPKDVILKIGTPQNNSKVNTQVLVSGVARNIPSDSDKEIWLIIYVYSTNLYYPQGAIKPDIDGNWSLISNFGSSQDTGKKFAAILLLADRQAQDEFKNYFRNAATISWSGMNELPEHTKEYDRIIVIRDDG